MTTGTKVFRIIISILLGFTVLCSVFFAGLFILHLSKEQYGIYVAGVSVTRDNKDDILGDGTVSYNSADNMLIFDNADIEHDYAIIISKIDLSIKLIGENRFLCKDREYITAIYAADGRLNRDLHIEGDGSLTIEFLNVSTDAQGILASNLTIASDINIIMPDCSNIVNCLICTSSLYVGNKASLTVNNGSGIHSSAVRVRGNALFEEGTSIDITINPGTVKTCKGLSINGDLILSENMTMNVSIDDAAAELSECIRVTGLIDVGAGTTVNAQSKNCYGIECYGPIKLGNGSIISADSLKEGADIFCYGAIVNYGSTINSEVEALGGVHNK